MKLLKQQIISMMLWMMSFSPWAYTMDFFNSSSMELCSALINSGQHHHILTDSFAMATLLRPLWNGSSYNEERNTLPLLNPPNPLVDRIRKDINRGAVSESNQYVAFVRKNQHDKKDYLAYGQIIDISTTPILKVTIQVLESERIIDVTGDDLYEITVSQRARKAFERKKTGSYAPEITPIIRKYQTVLVPRSEGGFSYGMVLAFIGDKVEVYVTDSRDSSAVTKQFAIQTLRRPIEVADIISIKGLSVEVIELMANGMLLVKGHAHQEPFLIHPEQIVSIFLDRFFIDDDLTTRL